MALLAHGFAPVSPGETGPTHTCSHVPQRPGVQPPPGFALSPHGLYLRPDRRFVDRSLEDAFERAALDPDDAVEPEPASETDA